MKIYSARTATRMLLGLALVFPLGFASAQTAEDTFEVSSPAFEHESDIPLRNSAYGDNISPELNWSGLPEGTEQLALIMEDPVVPMPQPFVHWVAYNIPASAGGLPADLPSDATVTGIASLEGLVNGLNGTRRAGYFGPRPPADGKVHLYHFRFFALDTELDLPEGLNKADLQEAIEGHVIATGTLTGHYQQAE